MTSFQQADEIRGDSGVSSRCRSTSNNPLSFTCWKSRAPCGGRRSKTWLSSVMKIERGRSLQARWEFLKQKGIHCEKEAGVGFGYLVLYLPARANGHAVS